MAKCVESGSRTVRASKSQGRSHIRTIHEEDQTGLMNSPGLGTFFDEERNFEDLLAQGPEHLRQPLGLGVVAFGHVPRREDAVVAVHGSNSATPLMRPMRSATECARPGWVSRTMFVTSTLASRLFARRLAQASLASIVIFALSSFEIGAAALGRLRRLLKRGLVGVRDLDRRLQVARGDGESAVRPARGVTVAFVSMLSAVIPASPRNSDSAIEKHAACAAAISSSGFVPFSFSNRMLKL